MHSLGTLRPGAVPMTDEGYSMRKSIRSMRGTSVMARMLSAHGADVSDSAPPVTSTFARGCRAVDALALMAFDDYHRVFPSSSNHAPIASRPTSGGLCGTNMEAPGVNRLT